jgi:hypothetical protein
LSLGYPHTALAGKRGRNVLAVPDPILDELAERGLGFTPLREDQLADYLTPQGLAYYRNLRRFQLEGLTFDAPLPPAQHVVLSCNVPEHLVEAVRQTVERYEPADFRTTEITVHRISLDPDKADVVTPMVQVVFTIPRRHHQALIQELIDRGAAGFDRATAIFIRSDPDGPPRGQ